MAENGKGGSEYFLENDEVLDDIEYNNNIDGSSNNINNNDDLVIDDDDINEVARESSSSTSSSPLTQQWPRSFRLLFIYIFFCFQNYNNVLNGSPCNKLNNEMKRIMYLAINVYITCLILIMFLNQNQFIVHFS